MNFNAGIIGFGKLGSVLARAFNNLGILLWISERNPENCKSAYQYHNNINILSDLNEIEELPDLILLTVQDSEIEETANNLSNHFKDRLRNKFVIHCSGSQPIKLLDSCKYYGAKTGVIHPYQTFFYPDPNILERIFWSIRTENDYEELSKLIKLLGGNSEQLKEDNNTISLYHASAVVASNFMTTIISLASELAKLSGIDPKKFIPAIVKTTIDNNIINPGNEDIFPLTGPYARGDLKTIENHIEALKIHPSLLKSYCYSGLATIEKVKHDQILDSDNINKIRELLIKNI